MALPGRLATIRVPTPMKTAKASSSPTVLASGSCWKLPLATDSVTRAATLTTHSASSAQATRVERLCIGRLLVIGGRSARRHAAPAASRDRYGTVVPLEGAEEAGGDRGGDLAADAAVLDDHGEGEVATEADEPGVGGQRVAGAELGRAGLAAGAGGEVRGRRRALGDDLAHERAEGLGHGGVEWVRGLGRLRSAGVVRSGCIRTSGTGGAAPARRGGIGGAAPSRAAGPAGLGGLAGEQGGVVPAAFGDGGGDGGHLEGAGGDPALAEGL